MNDDDKKAFEQAVFVGVLIGLWLIAVFFLMMGQYGYSIAVIVVTLIYLLRARHIFE